MKRRTKIIMMVVVVVFIVPGTIALVINSTGDMDQHASLPQITKTDSNSKGGAMSQESVLIDDAPLSNTLSTDGNPASQPPDRITTGSVTDAGYDAVVLADVSDNCALFCDSAGYEPSWAKSMGQNQASSKCLGVNTPSSIGSADWNWCNEYNGYLLDMIGMP